MKRNELRIEQEDLQTLLKCIRLCLRGLGCVRFPWFASIQLVRTYVVSKVGQWFEWYLHVYIMSVSGPLVYYLSSSVLV